MFFKTIFTTERWQRFAFAGSMAVMAMQADAGTSDQDQTVDQDQEKDRVVSDFDAIDPRIPCRFKAVERCLPLNGTLTLEDLGL